MEGLVSATAGSRLVVAAMKCKSSISSGEMIVLLSPKKSKKKLLLWRYFSFMMLSNTDVLKNAPINRSHASWRDQVSWRLIMAVGWVRGDGAGAGGGV